MWPSLLEDEFTCNQWEQRGVVYYLQKDHFYIVVTYINRQYLSGLNFSTGLEKLEQIYWYVRID